MKLKWTHQGGWFFACGLIAAVCLAGCQTADDSDSGDMASVRISGHTEAEIQKAAARAFLANGYLQDDPMTFEKRGTEWDKIAQGGWLSGPVWIKMRIHLAEPEPGQCILGCDAFAVLDRDDPSMESENKFTVSYRSECKKILDQVRTQLDAPPKPTP